MRFSTIFLLIVSLDQAACAQTVTGSWYGIADPATTSSSNNYLTELIIKQKGDDVEGVFGYYFRDGYQSYYIRGKYNASTRLLSIKNVLVTYHGSRSIEGIDCPMDFSAILMTSKVKSTLKGSFKSHEKYKYTCPELMVNYSLDISETNQDSIIKNSSVGIKKIWKPRQEELVYSTKDTPSAALVIKDIPKNADSVKAIEEKKAEIKKIATSFEQRKNIMNNTVEVENDSIRISFYDNGDIDGDSISIFINKVPVLIHQPLSEKALNLYIAMDEKHGTNEISMFAENLGKYPPNTALMVISDGEKRHEVFMSSSLTQNSSVIIKRKKK